ncbi:MAG: M28 family peptidase [Gemmatimonadetes bacterium]|nr:M28 family peptidase [Gemmatimonadota bacterium]
MTFAYALIAAMVTQAPTGLSPAERAAYQGVREATIREITTTLASPAMEGRGTGQLGGQRAAEYLAARMRQFGLQPAGDSGSYLQRIDFVSAAVLPTSSLTAGEARLVYRDDFLVAGRVTGDSLDVSGGVVFVGYGVDLSGLDLQGRLAVLLQGKPATADSMWERTVNPRAVVQALVRGGAAALLILPDPAGPAFTVYAQYLTRRGVRLADTETAPQPPVVYVSEAGVGKLAAGLSEAIAQARAGSAAARDLGVTVQLAVRAKVERVSGSNVVGVLRGGDPKLAGQAVLYSAHYDAYGIENGTVYPGAADNALGAAMMLAAGEVLATEPRPRRSVIFLAVTGEEYGLHGARHWAQHPTWPIDSVAANFNYDGIGTETYGPVTQVVGWGGEYSDLGAVMRGVVTATGNSVAPDPFPEENVFYRSDHYAFVQRGVPALMLLGAPADTTWVRRAKAWLEGGDYHQPGDSVRASWNWSGPRTLAATGLLIGLRVANADVMPAWLPGAPFRRR